MRNRIKQVCYQCGESPLYYDWLWDGGVHVCPACKLDEDGVAHDPEPVLTSWPVVVEEVATGERFEATVESEDPIPFGEPFYLDTRKVERIPNPRSSFSFPTLGRVRKWHVVSQSLPANVGSDWSKGRPDGFTADGNPCFGSQGAVEAFCAESHRRSEKGEGEAYEFGDSSYDTHEWRERAGKARGGPATKPKASAVQVPVDSPPSRA